jgi:hypothetical protein
MSYKPNFRGIYKRMGILSGNTRTGYYCELCKKEVKTTAHFKSQHKDYFERAKSFLLVSKHHD